MDLVAVLGILSTVPLLAEGACKSSCQVCCEDVCCATGFDCCGDKCGQDCGNDDKTTVWIIVGVVIAVIIALVIVCVLIACIYCCKNDPPSHSSPRNGTAVRSFRHHERNTNHTGSRARYPRHQHTSRDQPPPRVFSTSDPSRNLTFSRNSPSFAPPPPGFVVPDGPGGSFATDPPPTRLGPLGFPGSPRIPPLPPAPSPRFGEPAEEENTSQNRDQIKSPDIENNLHDGEQEEEDVESQSFSRQKNSEQSHHLSIEEPTPSKSQKPMFTRSPKVSSAGMDATPTPRDGAVSSASGFTDPRSPRHIEITSLDSD